MQNSVMMEIENAVRRGDKTFILQALEENPDLLMGPASRNLVQLASKYGKHTVVMLLLARRPSLAMERNEDGYCSIHLAAAHGYEIVILEHLKFNRSLCIIRDNNGWTPLHWATTKGRTGVIQLILRESVENIQSLTFKGESCFHLAVQHSQSEAFRILVHWLEQLTCEHMKNLINTRDNEGFAVLHKVVLKNQYQILEALISSKRICRALQVNITDASGLTALDLFYQYSNEPDREIGELLNRVGASRARRPRPVLIPINDDDNINGRNIFLVQLLARFLRVINSDNSDRIPIEILGFLLQLVAAVLIYSLQAVNSPFVSNTEHLEGQRFHYNIGDLLRGYGEPAQVFHTMVTNSSMFVWSTILILLLLLHLPIDIHLFILLLQPVIINYFFAMKRNLPSFTIITGTFHIQIFWLVWIGVVTYSSTAFVVTKFLVWRAKHIMQRLRGARPQEQQGN